jgi:hypothetical protein
MGDKRDSAGSTQHGEPEPEASMEEVVITPGGPTHREKARSVEPGQVVRREADGTYTIVPHDRGEVEDG